MTTHFVSVLAVQWWLASGTRSRERLNGLVEHYADVYGIAGEHRGELREQAWKLAQQKTGQRTSAK